MKESDIRLLWASANMEVYFVVVQFSYNVINLLDNIGIKAFLHTTPSIPEYSGTSLYVSIPEKRDGYVKIVQQWSNIEWKDTFIGNSIRYYFIFNNLTALKNIDIDIYNFTVLLDWIDNDILIYPEKNGTYPQLPVNVQNLSDTIRSLTRQLSIVEEPESSTCQLSFNGSGVYFISPFSDTKNLVRVFQRRNASFSNNPNFNMISTSFADKGVTDMTKIVLQKSSVDDITPVMLNSSYIGGNHGWNQLRVLTLANHRKTFADIGAKYKDDNGVTFVILYIANANSLWIISENQATDGYSYDFRLPSGTLTYQSNGKSTTALSGYTITSTNNLYKLYSLINKLFCWMVKQR